MLDDLKIGTKLTGGFLLVALVAAGIGLTGLLSARSLLGCVDEIGSVRLPGVEGLLSMQEAQNAVLTGERGLLESRLFGDPQVREAQEKWIASAWDRAERGRKVCEALPRTAEEEQAWNAFVPAWQEWKAGHEVFMRLAEEKARLIGRGCAPDDPALVAADERMLAQSLAARQAFLNASDKLSRLVQDNVEAAAASGAAARKAGAQAQATILFATLIGLTVAIGLGTLLSARLSRPLARGVAMLRELQLGHLGERLRLTRRDEVGELARTMDAFADDLQGNVVSALQRMAAGDLSVQLTPKDLRDEISPAVNATTSALRDLIAEMNRMAEEQRKGDVDAAVDAVRFRGDYQTMAAGINAMVAEHVAMTRKAMACFSEFGAGRFEATLEPLPGKQRYINETIDQVRANLRALSTDLELLVQSAQEGKLSVRAEAGRHQGDFRKIVEGLNELFNAVVTPVNEAAAVLAKLAERDLAVRMEGNYRGDFARIKESLNMAAANLDEALEQVATAVEQVASAAGQIGQGAQALAQGASEQASSLEEVGANLQEMASMTRQNAGNSQEARGLTETSRTGVQRGLESMQRLSEAMEKIKASSDATARIVKTIDEIAFQTNLLALNAAVEAARAGDAGKGFAVVAEEVRNLAMRSAEAAKSTAELIDESVHNAESGVALNQTVLGQLQEITGQTNQVGEVMGEIATASEQQSSGIEQITSAVEQMNQLTQQNAANSEESASAAEELSGQAEELRGLVAAFRLSRQAAAGRSAGASWGGGRSVGAGSAWAGDGRRPERAVSRDRAAGPMAARDRGAVSPPATERPAALNGTHPRAAAPGRPPATAAPAVRLRVVGGGSVDPESVIPFSDGEDEAALKEF